jgi:hypothetical protein
MKTFANRVIKVLLLMLLPAWALACNCPPGESAAARANLIFVGRCVDVSPNPIKGDLNVVFQVDSSWKRQVESFATVHTPTTDCHYAFTKGKRYLVYTNKAHQTFKTSICEPNLLLDDAQVVQLPELGKAYLPGRPEFAQRMNLILIGLGVGGLLLVAVVVLRKRVFRPKGQAA